MGYRATVESATKENTMEVLIVIGIIWVAPIFIAASVGNRKGRAGWLYGILLGWLGVLLVALLPPKPHVAVELKKEKQLGTTHRECPWCFEPMRREATVCPHCQHSSEKAPPPAVPELTASQANWWTQETSPKPSWWR